MPPAVTTKAARVPAASAAVRAARTRGRGRVAAQAARRRERTPGFQLDCATGSAVRHVGIVFVHGIGSQEPAETLLDWGGAIIRLLLDVRVHHRAAADPVIASQLDTDASGSRYIELQVPAAAAGPGGGPVPEQHWVMTEAWWAQRVRPPAFGQMAEWLGPRGAIRRIVLAILPRPNRVHDPRLRPSAEHHPLRRIRDGGVEEAVDPGPPVGQTERESAPTRAVQPVLRVSASLYLQAISAFVLVIYGALRAIEKLLPIGPLRDGALTRPVDEFVLNWFGDVYVLLGDPAQAASVRGRLVDAIEDLHAANCDTVVVVAHSGGAIVSYMTLTDKANLDLRVDRLITLGEGLNLAWLLTGGEDGTPPKDASAGRYQRLYTDVLGLRPNLRWDDFWASQDPAPVGVLRVPRLQRSDARDSASLARIESHAIWNRLSFSEDHGGYWDNDEEFLLPMLRLIDDRPPGSSYFGTDAADRLPSNRRRQRLSILSLWRQLTFVAPTAAVVTAFALGSNFVHRSADAVATVWAAIPGSELISGPVNTLRGLDLARGVGGGSFAEAGVWVVALLIGLVTVFALIAPPERQVPWATTSSPWIGKFLALVPWLMGVPILVVVALGALRFIAGATPTGVEIGRALIIGAALGVALLVVIPVVLGDPGESDDERKPGLGGAVRDAVDLLQTVGVLVFATFLTIAPFVATIAFDQVGRTVLGSLTVLAIFQVLGRIGGWRWSVWDERERMAARSRVPYPGLRRVVAQGALLFATLALLFVAVIVNSSVALALAAAGAGVAVLLGVSVDVFDASPQREGATPADSLLRYGRTGRGR